jgi:DNA mismatch endonuclease (patch repair protein)
MKHVQLDTTPEISKRMSNIKAKRNAPETFFAKQLWHQGYRYRLNDKKLPGSPDIAITKYRIAIFIDGEFWHGKDFETFKQKSHNNKQYWLDKITENMQRDAKVDQQLRMMGWIPVRFWSKDVTKYPEECIGMVRELIEKQLEE